MRPSRATIATTFALAIWGCASPPPKPGEPADPFALPAEPAVTRVAVAPERSVEALKDAIRLLREGQFAQADANLEEVRRVRPDIPEVHFNLGWAKLQRRRYPEAVAHLQEGLRLRPGEMRAYALAGIAYREQGLFREAEKAYLEGLAVAPEDDRLHFNLGVLYDLYLLDPDKALTHYQAYQSRQPEPDAKVAGWIAVLEREHRKRQAAPVAAGDSPAATVGAPRAEDAPSAPAASPPVRGNGEVRKPGGGAAPARGTKGATR